MITVRFFASLRESLNIEDMQISAQGVATVTDAWNSSTQNREVPDNVLVAVNMEYVKFNYKVADNDEVAFFPPVTGG